jgi:amino acid adenylation domain-containing protein
MSAIDPDVSRASRRKPVAIAPVQGIVPRAGERTRAALSFAQERLWILDRLERPLTAYNLPKAWRLSGPLNVAALERALGEIVRRHDTLRTTFDDADGSPVQVIAPFRGLTLPVIDLSTLEGAARDAAVHRAASDEARWAFDLATGPLVRVALLRLDVDEHVLLLNMHHIITDGLSVVVLLRELSALYAAYREGRESPLPELPIQYADYAAWQRAHLQGEALERSLAYWVDQLAGAPALLELPTDHPRPVRPTHGGARESIELPRALVQSLQALGRGEMATPFMVLLSAFQILLSQYSGSEDIVVGSPIAGRVRKETEALIGFFANTLALRARLSGDPTFRQVLQRVRRTTLDAYDHQDLPFERLVAALHPERSLSHAPLVQALFNLYRPSDPRLAGVRLDEVVVDAETSKVDLALHLATTGDGMVGVLSYSTDLFERPTMRRMVRHFVHLLSRIAANPDVRLSELDCLDDAERRQVVDVWSTTPLRYRTDQLVHHRFEAWAMQTPHEDAVADEHVVLTYAELNGRANRLAHHLRGLGVGPDVRVGIGLERGADTIVAMLAILKAGGAYVPYDISHPVERLASLVADAGITVLVTQTTVRDRFAGVAVPVIRMDGDAEDCAHHSTENPAPIDVGPDRLAYVIYTSGSTGVPNGVMVSHGALRHYVEAVAQRLTLEAGWRYGLVSTFAADLGHTAIFPALTTGGALRIVPHAIAFDPARLAACFASGPVDVLKIVPSHLDALLSGEGAAAILPRRRLVCGGEQLPAGLVARVGALAPACEIFNHYGPTETTVGVIAQRVSNDTDGRPIALGRPLGNTRCYVLDAAMRPLPIGIPGELFIGGAQVARGYLDRPGLTARRFVPDPFGASGARLYRTGDRVQWRANGEIEYLGRLDTQIKIRGFRVEPREVERALSVHPAVSDARVIVREDDAGAPQLMAYVVGDATPETLRADLRQRLPEYLVPAAIVLLDRLPLTPNGKLDTKALPAATRSSTTIAVETPRTPVEDVLAGIWTDVLRRDRVGRDDNFFALGGDSLQAIRVVSRVRDALGVELPVVALFDQGLAELAARVETLRQAETPGLPPIVPVARSGPLPLSFAQERLWFLDRLEPGHAFYNVPIALRLTGPLHLDALRAAFGAIVQRHEILRTTFREIDGVPHQVIAPVDGAPGAPLTDLSALDAADRDAAVTRHAHEDAAQPFDLAAGPLLRVRLLRLDAATHVLLLTLHHVISDGWSVDVLVRELAALYAAARAGAAAPLRPLPIQYADYAVWQRTHQVGDALARARAWWRTQLAGAPALLALPTDHPRPAVQAYRGARTHLDLPPTLLADLRALGRREGATLFMVVLGAVQVLLAKYTGSPDIVVGTPVAGRTRREIEPLLGCFVNTLVLRTDLRGDPSARDIVRRARAVTLDAFDHQEVPFEQLVAELQPDRSLSHAPLVQVLFTLQEAEAAAAPWPDLQVERLPLDGETTKFDLLIGVVAHAAGLRLTLTYSTALFEPDTITRLGQHLAQVLTQMGATPDARGSALTLLTPPERTQIVEAWNQTAAPTPAETLHGLVERQATQTPDAIALHVAHETLTYHTLNARADRLAQHLRAHGVGPEQRVGLCLARGVELVVGLLAVLKAGGAYVPLDPRYPAERLTFMLADSGARLVVTQAAVRDRLPAHADLHVVCVDDPATDLASLATPPPDGLPPTVGPDNLAYVIYTSGSTGQPKAVALEHRSAVALVAWAARVYAPAELDGVLASTSICFDLSIFELFLPLAVGGRVLLVDHALSGAAAGPVRLINTVPSVIAELLQQDAIPPSVTTVNLAGEPLKQGLVDALYARGIARVYDLYGPSEDTTYSTYTLRRPGGRPSIGRPIANTRAYVLDPAQQPVPIGIPGELYLGGAGLARGYLARPAQTAARFVPDAFGAEPGGRLYRTGDRVRWQPNGDLEFLGRLDRQVKVRGFRIEPGEIEGALERLPTVQEACVLVREDVAGEPLLVAYVVGPTDTDDLRAQLRQTLPDYLVPTVILPLDALPRTPTRKVDVQALPRPHVPARAAATPPRTATEARVADLWRRVLGLDPHAAIDVHRNFFELGGDSLRLYRVFSQLRDIRPDLRVVDLFRYTTVDALAAFLHAPASQDHTNLAPSRARAEARKRRARVAPRRSVDKEPARDAG